MLHKLIKKAKQIHRCCYDLCYDLIDSIPTDIVPPFTQTAQPKPAPEVITFPEVTTPPAAVTSKPTLMKGFLCASFEDETSLGLAAMVIAIDEGHAKQLLNQELKKHKLRLEEDDTLIEIDLHNPGVLLSMNDSVQDSWNAGW